MKMPAFDGHQMTNLEDGIKQETFILSKEGIEINFNYLRITQ